jgi:membrane-bound ClpP family serine protease
LTVGLALLPSSLRADDAKEGGIFIPVKNPLNTNGVEWIKKEVERAKNLPNAKLKKVVFDFNPDNTDSNTADYGICDTLAHYIRELSLNQGIQTIAFVHKKVTGHTVLAVLACNDVVMSDNAQIGEVVGQNDPAPPKEHTNYYRDLAGKYREAVVLKMMDKNMEVVTGLEDGKIIYVDPAKVGLAGDFQGVTIPPANRANPYLARGALALLDLQKAMSLGIAQKQANTQAEVKEEYNVQPLIARPFDIPKACRIDLIGPVNDAMVARLKDQFKEVKARKENLIFFNFDCGGGDLSAAREAADMILKLEGNDKQPIVTVAYIPAKAPDLSTFLALACTEIVMYRDKDLEKKADIDPGQAYEAVLGDFEGYLKNAAKGNDVGNTTRILNEQLVELANARGKSEILVRGMIDKNEVIQQVQNTAGVTKFMSEDERKVLNQKAGKEEWKVTGSIKQRGSLLKLDATRAKKFHFIDNTVDNQDIRLVYRLYDVDEKNVRNSHPSWMDDLATFLSRKEVIMLLVLIGIAGLILEIKMPGATIPGLVFLTCFVLFFWSMAYMNGFIVLYAIGLFVVGVILLAVEVFVLPGFGIAGISGIILLLVGISLATLEKAPSSPDEWSNFAVQVFQYGLALVMSGVLAFFVGRYLPKIPYVNRMMLVPPAERADLDSETSSIPGAAEAAALLGHVGVASSMLRPAGMAKFGDSYVDVVTEGDYIEPGTPIQVVEVEGNRIVVKRV